MPYIERYLGGIIRIETSTREEQAGAATRIAELVDKLTEKQPVWGIMQQIPDATRRERVRQVFVFGRLFHQATIMDSLRS